MLNAVFSIEISFSVSTQEILKTNYHKFGMNSFFFFEPMHTLGKRKLRGNALQLAPPLNPRFPINSIVIFAVFCWSLFNPPVSFLKHYALLVSLNKQWKNKEINLQ